MPSSVLKDGFVVELGKLGVVHYSRPEQKKGSAGQAVVVTFRTVAKDQCMVIDRFPSAQHAVHFAAQVIRQNVVAASKLSNQAAHFQSALVKYLIDAVCVVEEKSAESNRGPIGFIDAVPNSLATIVMKGVCADANRMMDVSALNTEQRGVLSSSPEQLLPLQLLARALVQQRVEC